MIKNLLRLSFILFVLLPFSGRAQFVLNGDAITAASECTANATTYELTPNALNQGGEIWYAVQASLTQRFDIQFQMYLGTKAYTAGADGICFVFQEQSINAGSSGGGLGYGGITPSLAVEFDTYENAWDPAFCHTAIEKNGDVDHTDLSGNNLAGPIQLSPTNPNLPDGNWHNVEIIWNPVYDSISVYFDCAFRIGYQGDIVTSIFSGNPSVYWGFTAGTGGDDNLQEVCVTHSYLNNLRDTALCLGDSTQLTTTGGVSYSWSPSAGLSSTTGSSVYAKPDTTTTYTVSIKNDCGVISQDSARIVVNPVPQITTATQTNLSCNGDNSGTASVTTTGGTLPYTYLWTGGGGTNATATGLAAGTYTVTINDANGCKGVSSIIVITQPPPIAETITTTTATCADNNGSINVSASGGALPYTYNWSPGGGSTAAITGISSGNYTVTVTDANGCSETVAGNVPINTGTFSVTLTETDSIICKGQSVTFNATGASNYLWSQGSTASTIGVSPTTTTSYWVVGKTGVCKDSIPYTINVYPPLAVTMVLPDSICPGTPVTLKVKSVTGGNPPYSYTWSNGITANSPGPIVVTPTTNTTYSVTVNDECNYQFTDSIPVKVFPVGTARFSVQPDTITAGEAVTFTNSSSNTNAYYWTFGDGSNSTIETPPSHPYPSPGTYQIVLVAYNSFGCADSTTEDVYVAAQVIIPNVFTPNGDGVNDVFYFTIRGAQCFHCNIYNRWGTMVYQINNINDGWDGKIQQSGQLAADGVYYYIVNYCDYKNDPQKLDGFIQLIRGK